MRQRIELAFDISIKTLGELMSRLQHINSPISDNPEPPKKKDVKKENTFLNLGFNLILPILLLNKGKQWFGSYLEPYFEN